jgi:hypothetical protein
LGEIKAGTNRRQSENMFACCGKFGNHGLVREAAGWMVKKGDGKRTGGTVGCDLARLDSGDVWHASILPATAGALVCHQLQLVVTEPTTVLLPASAGIFSLQHQL